VTTASMTEALPTGATARVERTGEGTRVTLRPCGVGRWFGVVFLAFWLCGWAVGELLAGRFLLALVGASLGLMPAPTSVPSGLAVVGIGAFLLFWLSLWTVGGIAALSTCARSGWGVDVLTVDGSHWTLRQGVGPWGRSRRIDPTEVQNLALRGNEGSLIAETDAGSVTLTSFGTAADRRWLLGMLRRSARLEAAPGREVVPRRHSSGAPVSLCGYRVEVLPDGTTRFTRTALHRIGQAGCLLFLNLFWNGIVGVFVAMGLGLIKGESDASGAMTPGACGYWLFLTPFIAVGLCMLYGLVWTALGREEWLAFPNCLQIRRSLLGNRWGWRFADGALTLAMKTDSDGDATWRLLLEAGGKVRVLDTGDPGQLRALGRLLAERTGWALDEAGSG
jgi:hypothetical protein